jgi:hypothetical protein
MIKKELDNLLENIDGSGSDSEYDAIHKLHKMEINLPSILLDKYKHAKKWQVRRSCVYHSIRYARDNCYAVQLGIEAISDKSKAVRFRACMLLAYSLDKKALPVLHETANTFHENETVENILAAIDAIENQNSNYFVDRDHTGSIEWNFEEID